MPKIQKATSLALALGLVALTLAAPAQNTVTVGGQTYAVGSSEGSGMPSASSMGNAQAPSPQKLQQMVAPIALYPDVLVTQILIASTYPTQVVEAYEWLQKNKSATAAQAQQAGQAQSWDPGIVSLMQFPDILTRMFQNLEWAQDLGEAFLQDKQSVMNAIQYLRQQAKTAGSLKSSSQQTVTETGTTIVIAPASPQVVYVPAYDPTVVYGAWAPGPWYYPPAVYAPWPGWVPGAGAFAFGAGVAVGAAWADAWHCDWYHGNVVVNNNYYHGYGTADGTYHGYNGNVSHYGATTTSYNKNTGEVHSYNAATGTERSGQAYQGAYGEGVKGENGSVAHAGDTTASYNKNTGEVHSYNSYTGNTHSGNVNNMDSWNHDSAGHYGQSYNSDSLNHAYGGGSYGSADRGYGGGEEHAGAGGWGGGGAGHSDAAASDRGWASRSGGGGSWGGGGGFSRGGGFHGGRR